ncbi:unnamed protein product [Adineta ricciae]|uniref:AtPDCT1/2 transmembrane domain-containing protein n=1 Tax=Adineta ricciae TaxID=249248 RepID=A0A813YNI5_ADIRI|nr:unnamed protein product [Adineta ricciae]CAF1439273.1 unnamed protein product [Adineta ricciae]
MLAISDVLTISVFRSDYPNNDTKFEINLTKITNFNYTSVLSTFLIWTLRLLILIGLYAMMCTIALIEFHSDYRPTNQTFTMVDIGFRITQNLHDYLSDHSTLHHWLAFLNTIGVDILLVYTVIAVGYWQRRPGIVIVETTMFLARLACGWLTQLPYASDYLPSEHDFPDCLTNRFRDATSLSDQRQHASFFYFFSGHVALIYTQIFTMISLVLLAVVLGLFIYLLYQPICRVIYQKSVYSSTILCPRSHPIFGVFFHLNGRISKAEQFRRLLSYWYEHPNEPVICLWFFIWPFLLINRSDYLEPFLGPNTKHITKSVQYSLFNDWLKTGLLTSTGAKWKARRRLITPSFQNTHVLTNCFTIFNEQIVTCMNRLQRVAETGEPVNLFEYVSAWTLDVICEMAMGKNVNVQTKESDYVKAVMKITDIIALRIRSPSLWFDPFFALTAIGKEHAQQLKVVRQFTQKVIEDRFEEFEKAEFEPTRMAFLDTLLSKMKDGTLSLEDVQEEVDTFMFGGHETTGTALNFACWMIALHPDVQRKLYEEMKLIFGNDITRPCTLEDTKQMEYLEQVIKESLRLLPSIPVIGREIQEDFEYDGKKFLKGTTVMMFLYTIHRDPRYFPEPEKFDPSRFSPENIRQIPPYAYIPFSAGARNCIGQRFALLEEKVFLSTLLRRYHVSTDQTYRDFEPTEEIILRSSNVLNIKLSPRNHFNH